MKQFFITCTLALFCSGIYTQNVNRTGEYIINFGKPYSWNSPYNKYFLAIVDSTKYDLYTTGYVEDIDPMPWELVKINDTFSIVLGANCSYGAPKSYGAYITSNDSILLTTRWPTDTVCVLKIIDDYNLQVVSFKDTELVGCVFNKTSEFLKVNVNNPWLYVSYSKWFIIRRQDGDYIKRTILHTGNSGGTKVYQDEFLNPNIFINSK